MDLLQLMATTHPTPVMEATVGSRVRRRPAPRSGRRTDAPSVASRVRAALTGRVTPEATTRVCATC